MILSAAKEMCRWHLAQRWIVSAAAAAVSGIVEIYYSYVWESNRHILPNSRRIPCDKESGIDLSMCWKCLDYSKCCRKRSRGPWGILCRWIIFRQHDEHKEISLISGVSERGEKKITKQFSISISALQNFLWEKSLKTRLRPIPA